MEQIKFKDCIEHELNQLAKERPIFHSEADFQHALAWQIHQDFPQAIVRLEIPSGRKDKRERIDILVKDKNITYAIELKYKKTKIDLTYQDEEFHLRPDIAQDISRYDFIKDIARLERFVQDHPKSIGYAIMLTNDDLYWREDSRGVNSAEFFLHEAREIKKQLELKWHSNTGPGTFKGRKEPHILLNDYKLHWRNYSEIPTTKKNIFKYLMLKITI